MTEARQVYNAGITLTNYYQLYKIKKDKYV